MPQLPWRNDFTDAPIPGIISQFDRILVDIQFHWTEPTFVFPTASTHLTNAVPTLTHGPKCTAYGHMCIQGFHQGSSLHCVTCVSSPAHLGKFHGLGEGASPCHARLSVHRRFQDKACTMDMTDALEVYLDLKKKCVCVCVCFTALLGMWPVASTHAYLELSGLRKADVYLDNICLSI